MHPDRHPHESAQHGLDITADEKMQKSCGRYHPVAAPAPKACEPSGVEMASDSEWDGSDCAGDADDDSAERDDDDAQCVESGCEVGADATADAESTPEEATFDHRVAEVVDGIMCDNDDAPLPDLDDEEAEHNDDAPLPDPDDEEAEPPAKQRKVVPEWEAVEPAQVILHVFPMAPWKDVYMRMY